MRTVSRKVYEQIQKDIPEIEEQIVSSKIGSGALWNKLKPRYSIMLPGLMSHIRERGKITSVGDEADYRPELTQLKEAIIAYLLVNEVEEQSNEFVKNDASDLMNKQDEVQEDTKINEIIEESKLYMRSDDSSKKQIALEKIWDAFERLKTVYEEKGSKRSKIENLIEKISYGSESNKIMLNDEFLELTRIGNEYQIRHFEKEKYELTSDEFREYLYFRMLSLISFCIKQSKEINR
ncbi:MAG TPA: hypothetical protein DEB42_00455 [Jeotgalicoccus sp.]|nr:hypothetical protein [Jeotgalicoccus sp.]